MALTSSTILFWDIDGTLLTTGRAGIFALQDALQDLHGVQTDLQNLASSGLTDAGVAELALAEAGREVGPEAVDAFLRSYERSLPASLHRRQGRVLPNVRDILAELEGRPDVVSLLLTGNTPAGAEAKLRHYSLERFFPHGGAFCAGMGPREEIAQRAYELAAGLSPHPPRAEQIYVIGDTPHDVRCGKAIGARTIAVATGSHGIDELAETEPWLVLDELPAPNRFRELVGVAAPEARIVSP